MKVLMFGWEFPPFNSGGLGTACYGLTNGLNKMKAQVTFVLPKAFPNLKADFVKLISADIPDLEITGINSPLAGYITSSKYSELTRGKEGIYGKTLYEEVKRYAQKASQIAKENEFDIIHAHDWLCYPAGIEAKKASGKPLVVHVHATEFDRTGGHPNQYVYDIERKGLEEADSIITVSNFTKEMVAKHYGIPHEKITVVHNAVEFSKKELKNEPLALSALKEKEKIVLFLGRITLQKGPDYFIYAAKKVLEIMPNVKFIIAGSGDMERFIIEKVAEMGIADKVLFTGFLRGKDIDRAYQMADLYVMPSVSEPFGITPLEAMKNNTPVIISKQSGVSEVINHCLKVDFWDINQIADRIIAALKYKELHNELKSSGSEEVKKFDWKIPAEKCMDVYKKILKDFNKNQNEVPKW